MTPTEIEDRFEEAARTLRRLPSVRVRGYVSSWPPILRSYHEAFGWEAARMPHIPPTPDAISRMEETFTWLSWLDPDDARIVWLRAENVRWKPICWRLGISRATAWRRWAAALITIAKRVENKRNRKPMSKPRKSVAASNVAAAREPVV
jgi:hypothetical protein